MTLILASMGTLACPGVPQGTTDQSRVDAMDQLKREVQQVQRYFREKFGTEKPHFRELVNKCFGLRSKLLLLFYSKETVNSQSFLGPISCRSQAMGSYPSDRRRGRGLRMVDQPNQQEYDDEQGRLPRFLAKDKLGSRWR